MQFVPQHLLAIFLTIVGVTTPSDGIASVLACAARPWMRAHGAPRTGWTLRRCRQKGAPRRPAGAPPPRSSPKRSPRATSTRTRTAALASSRNLPTSLHMGGMRDAAPFSPALFLSLSISLSLLLLLSLSLSLSLALSRALALSVSLSLYLSLFLFPSLRDKSVKATGYEQQTTPHEQDCVV